MKASLNPMRMFQAGDRPQQSPIPPSVSTSCSNAWMSNQNVEGDGDVPDTQVESLHQPVVSNDAGNEESIDPSEELDCVNKSLYFRLMNTKEANPEDCRRSCVATSKCLTFRQYFSFNHPIYAATLWLSNHSDDGVAYKIVPSNTDKLCMSRDSDEGIIEPNQGVKVTIMTNPMVPYKYVDIMEETIQIWLVSVEVQHFKQNFSGIKNPSYFLWTEASPSTLRRFWTQHLFGEEIQVQTTIVKNFKPLHRSYLLEKSLMWAECRIWKALRKTFSTLINLNPFNALSDMVSIEFQRHSYDAKLLKSMLISRIFPSHTLDLEMTLQIAATSEKVIWIRLQKKIIKFLLFCANLYLLYHFAPFFNLPAKVLGNFVNYLRK